uniref:Lethal giant larvae (Lgl)-like C-terminal domain-containing protein n=1 Tax=Zea mays TaxID=4577 RepID=A0A804MBU6_MAIZE
MFVKKLVERASKKQHIGSISSLRPENVSPRLAFHYGVPADAALLAYDPVLHVLAVATRNGQIKLFGRDNTQALLQSPSPLPSRFLQFAEGQGVLLNVNTQNQIEVWDIDAKKLCYLHPAEKAITAFSVLQKSFYIYVGDSSGSVSPLKLDLAQRCLADLPYWIPFTESYGSTTSAGNDVEVVFVSPQPLSESNRVLIIFRDGVMSLWDIKASKAVSISGKTTQQQSQKEAKNVTSACWVCAKGSKIAIGYDNGDLYIWAIPEVTSTQNSSSMGGQNLPIQRLNLGYKLDKLPIVSLQWIPSDGKAGRLYINGFNDHGHLFQVLILNEESESRIVKMVLPIAESCQGMELVTGLSDPNKHRQSALALLLKSGHICLYDDSEIERYLLHSQSRSPPTLPNCSYVKLPYGDSGISVAKFYTSNPAALASLDEDYFSSATKYPCLFSMKGKGQTLTSFTNIHKTRNLYITGHLDGTISFWDASCPHLLQIFMIKQQNKDDTSTGNPITSLQFDMSSSILLSGERSGMVHIITFKKDSSDNIFSFLNAKQGDNYDVRSIKLKGAVTTMSSISKSKHFAVGTEKGIVSVINVEDATILYQEQFECRLPGGIASLQFEIYSHNGYDKDILIIAMEDSSIFVIEEETGKLLNPNPVQTDKPSKAILLQMLELSPIDTPAVSDNQDTVSKESLLLLCTENAIRLFSLGHAIQGTKKIINKKKLSSCCCFASLIHSSSNDIGLILVFSNGKLEIRSLPDLSLLKDAFLRGFVYSRNLNSSSSITCSSDGEAILINGEETYFFSTLCQDEIYRHVDSISTVYRKENSTREDSSFVVKSPKEKKKGLFGMIMKDNKGSKSKESDAIGSEQCIATTSEELASIFSSTNFAPPSEGRNSSLRDDENAELDIDDIDIDDNPQKPKGPHFPGLSKDKISKGLQTLKGKLKPKTEEKISSGNKKTEDETSVSQVDQIKMKYGYANTTNDDSTSVTKMIGNKLQENMKKLEVRCLCFSNQTMRLGNQASRCLT